MRKRINQLGRKNLIGKQVYQLIKESGISQKELMAKMQSHGVDINYSSLSKLEGQTRIATDYELVAIAKIFGVNLNDLVDNK